MALINLETPEAEGTCYLICNLLSPNFFSSLMPPAHIPTSTDSCMSAVLYSGDQMPVQVAGYAGLSAWHKVAIFHMLQTLQ
jgi:hypothetical protein